MTRITTLAVLLATLPGCFLWPFGGDETFDQTDTCAIWMDCVAETSPESLGGLLTTYGSEGSCWTTEDGAAACDVACESGLRDDYVAHREVAACDPSGVIDEPSIPADWDGQTFYARFDPTGGDCELSSFDTDVRITVDGDQRFTMEWMTEDYMLRDFDFACSVDWYDVTCGSWTVGAFDIDLEGEIVGDFAGLFLEVELTYTNEAGSCLQELEVSF